MFLTVLLIGSEHLSCGLVNCRFFLKVILCYFQNLGFGPLILLAFKCLKAIYLGLCKFSFSSFYNDEDIIFGLQSECRESELIPKLLSVPTFLPQIPPFPF